MTALETQIQEIIGCDSVRISSPMGKMFAIIGYTRNTKDDNVVSFRNGEKMEDYDYQDEKVVASGNTEEELIASVKEYKRLCGISMEEYLLEEIKKQQ